MQLLERIKMQQTTAKHPDYYTLADGRGFIEFFEEELFALLCDDLDTLEISRVESACEHLFRRGMKPGEPESADQAKADWWMKQAEKHFANNNQAKKHYANNTLEFVAQARSREFARIVRPVLAMIEWERGKKLSAAK